MTSQHSEGLEAAMKIIRLEEFNRFCGLQDQLIALIPDGRIRQEMTTALSLMRVLNAE